MEGESVNFRKNSPAVSSIAVNNQPAEVVHHYKHQLHCLLMISWLSSYMLMLLVKSWSANHFDHKLTNVLLNLFLFVFLFLSQQWEPTGIVKVCEKFARVNLNDLIEQGRDFREGSGHHGWSKPTLLLMSLSCCHLVTDTVLFQQLQGDQRRSEVTCEYWNI